MREGWTITHDPYVLLFGIHDLQIDLGAEMPIGAEREGRKIAVEIKSFLSISTFGDLYHAIGQFQFYHSLLKRSECFIWLFPKTLIIPYSMLKREMLFVVNRKSS